MRVLLLLLLSFVASALSSHWPRGRSRRDNCAGVRCFAACPVGTCSPRPDGACCDDLGKCSAGGCCGDSCYGDWQCKAGPCGRCRWSWWSWRRTCGGRRVAFNDYMDDNIDHPHYH